MRVVYTCVPRCLKNCKRNKIDWITQSRRKTSKMCKIIDENMTMAQTAKSKHILDNFSAMCDWIEQLFIALGFWCLSVHYPRNEDKHSSLHTSLHTLQASRDTSNKTGTSHKLPEYQCFYNTHNITCELEQFICIIL